MQVITAVEHEANKPEVLRFFRYVRPLDEHPNNLGRLAAQGGITFYIEYAPAENRLAFAFTICRDDEAFVRVTGRDQAQDRFVKGHFYTIENYDDESWIVDNIMFALHDWLGYTELSFAPQHIPTTMPYIGETPSLADPKEQETLELLLGKLLRDAVTEEYVEIDQAITEFEEAYDKLKKALVV